MESQKKLICIRTGISIGARPDAHGLLEVKMRVSASERKLFFFLLVLFFAAPANAQDLVLSGVIVTPDKLVDKGWVVIKGGVWSLDPLKNARTPFRSNLCDSTIAYGRMATRCRSARCDGRRD